MANAASGMAVHDDCKLKFLELKAKRTFRTIVYKIEDKQVIVEKLGEPEQSYDDFAASLPDNECRYAIYDFDFVTEENVSYEAVRPPLIYTYERKRKGKDQKESGSKGDVSSAVS